MVCLDADVSMSSAALKELAEELRATSSRVGSLGITVDVDECARPVRAFYAVFLRLPYAGAGLVGLGLYALSEAGRARFTSFPGSTADDRSSIGSSPNTCGWCCRPSIRGEDASQHHGLVAGEDAGALRQRRAAANADEDARLSSSAGGSARALVGLVAGHPTKLPPDLVYTGITLAARCPAAVRTRRGLRVWDRNTTTR